MLVAEKPWMMAGPKLMFVALLGHYIADAPGAIVSTAAMCGPTCFLACGVSQAFERFRTAGLTKAIQAGWCRSRSD